MSSPQDHSRWFSLSDGTLTFTATLYEAMKYTQDIKPLGGYDTLRMMDGSALKQQNWVKNAVTISGSGGIPAGLVDLNYSVAITFKAGAPRSVKRPTNSFTLPSHRTDTGYEPVVLKRVDGFWIPVASTGTAQEYMTIYYPQLTCLFEPPSESYAWDEQFPASWSLSGEEV